MAAWARARAISARSRAATARSIAASRMTVSVGCRRRGRGGKVKQPGFVERRLLAVASSLSVVERLLADVARQLLTIDPHLAIIEVGARQTVGRRVEQSLLVVAQLRPVDPVLVLIAGELLTVGQCLLKVGEALFPGQLVGTARLA